MRTYLLTLFVMLAAPLFAQQNVPALQFESAPDFFKLPPDMNFGEVSGVAVDSKGHVFVFSRSNSANGPAYAPTAAQLLEFDRNGKFVREIGKGIYAWSFAHTVRVDRDDNIWAVDKGSDMVVKFNQAGRITMVFGRRKESADDETGPWEHPDPPLPHVDGLFRQPTDVAWDSQGQHLHQRRLRQLARGEVRQERRLGEVVGRRPARGPANSACRTRSRSIANDNVYVGDRSNRRIQVFDADGRVPADVHDRRAAAARHAAGQRQHADRPGAREYDRRAELDLHYARRRTR